LLEIQVAFALSGSEISAIANYTFSICQKFNHYYHLFPVIAEADSRKRNLRTTVILLVKDRLEKLLHIMGIPIPPKM
jgi:arginyl-tRNA synthetase